MSVRVGIIGCGKIAERHINAYNKIENIDIVISDIDPEKEAVAEQRGVEWRDSPNELLTGDSVDAIDLCTPVATHKELISDAVDADKHVFCEKPLAPSLEDAQRIEEITNAADQIVMVGYLYRYHPAFQFVREVLQDGIIGEPYNAIFRVGGRGSASRWKHKKDSHGGAANEMLVHMIDLIHWYFDSIDSVENLYTDTIINERVIDGETVDATAEDLMILNMKTTDGMPILCQSDLITPSYMNYIEIQGTNGSLWTTILDYFPTVVYCKEPRGIYDRGHNYREFSQVDLFEKELNEFVYSIQNGTSPENNSVSDSVAIREIIDSSFN